MNTKQKTSNTSKYQDVDYAIIWFEGDETYTLVDKNSKTLVFSYQQVLQDSAGVLLTEDDIEGVEDDLRYAISVELLEDYLGWVA